MATIVVKPFSQAQADEIRRVASAQQVSEQSVLNWLVQEAMRRNLLSEFRAQRHSDSVLGT